MLWPFCNCFGGGVTVVLKPVLGTPATTHFICLSHRPHPFQVLQTLLMRWVESGVLNEGDIQNMLWLGVPRTGLRTSGVKPGIHCAIFVRFWAEFWLVRLFFWVGPNFSFVVRRLSCSVRSVYRGKREAISLSRQAIGRSDEFLTCQKFWSPLVRVSHSWSKATNRLP